MDFFNTLMHTSPVTPVLQLVCIRGHTHQRHTECVGGSQGDCDKLHLVEGLFKNCIPHTHTHTPHNAVWVKTLVVVLMSNWDFFLSALL